ncbi:TOX high mobility group box family member 4b isoform X1 [Gadus morhua]|uniref:TOX high mobility group box family member 4b isoform X1 n=1 Tax=Gadus morhua TaxID=8049 RepID=UPI0011B64C3D|nr:TOX high mobility group box family member 4-A-like isoform X1 [Gadus morhua]
MDLNFYSDLTDETGQHVDTEFLDPQAFNGFDSVGKFPGASNSYLTMSGSSHPFLSSSETFHTPSLGDEEFEIPSIPLEPDSALSSSHHGVSHFGDPSPDDGVVVPGNAVVGGDDPSFASTYVNTPSQGLEHLSLGGISQPGGGALLGSSLGMDLGHPIGSQFSSASPMTIDVPLGDMGQALLATNQLTTIDQSELSAQLGLGLVGGAMLEESQSPDNRLSPAASPTSSLQDDDMDDFSRSVLVDSPVSLSGSQGVISLDPSVPDSPFPSSSFSSATSSSASAPARGRRAAAGGGGGVGKKGRKKKDPNEPVKPVSAYALFFRDTQAAIKGQNPNAAFGEVSRIVASMWDSLGEEQKQVYKRKNDAAKREYLRALGAYRAGHVSQAPIEVLDDSSPSPPPITPPSSSSSSSSRPSRVQPYNPEENTITNICTSNIILDLPQMSTRSRTGVVKPPAPSPPPAITKIIIKRSPSPSGGVTVTAMAAPPRQPPPLQPMHGIAPPPPRLQQMVHSQAPPPLQAKPQGAPATGGSMAPPPPLQIKIVPAKLQVGGVVMTTTTLSGATDLLGDVGEMEQSAAAAMVMGGEEAEGEMEVEVSVTPGSRVAPAASTSVCVRAGCVNPAVESQDWDKEYCSNECVATHCRDVFMAWCAIRGQNSTTVT